MMIPSFVTTDGCRLAYESVGQGWPVVWQHGLGADKKQPAEVFPLLPGVRRITLECRGHGHSELCSPERLSIASFTDDVLELLNYLGIAKAVVGGISLGAAIALRLAALHPERVSGLIMARPAWMDGPSMETMAPYALVAALIAQWGAEDGLSRFVQSSLFQEVQAVSPDNAQSLQSFFSRPNPESTVQLLSKIAIDSPAVEGLLTSIAVPTLIVANDQEFVHPLSYAYALREKLPHATLQIITSKTVDREAYKAEFQAALSKFLTSLASSS